jgi:MoxR-like ATPase
MSAAEDGTRAALLDRAGEVAVRAHAEKLAELRSRLANRIVGQEEVVREVIAAILSEGHCLIVGVPGLAKTLLIRSIAALLSLEFKRIQFTPDLMPSDITGATLIRESRAGGRGFHFLRGPIFANVILADEINRTPPKTQAALMEAMEERQVTAAGQRLPLPRPFFVLATQNPIEQEGTYPLPVSQLDRFQQEIRIDYPSGDEEFAIVQLTTSAYQCELEPLLDRADLLDAIALARRVRVSERLIDYAARLVRRTRPSSPDAPDFVREWVSWGAGPRAIQSLLAAARSLAFLAGRVEVIADDLHSIVHSTLRHRILRTYHAEAEGVGVDLVIDRILESMPDGLQVPRGAAATRAGGRSGRGFFRSGLVGRWLRRSPP